MNSSRQRMHLYLSSKLKDTLEDLATRRQIGVSAVIEGLLESALSGDDVGSKLGAIENRISTLTKRVSGVRTDIEILGELVSFYVLQWLSHTPVIHESQRNMAVAEGRERHQRFLEILYTKLRKGEFSMEEIFSEREKVVKKAD